MTAALGIALILFVAALVVFVIDLLIPTGGILIAVTSILGFASIVFAFRHSPVSGVWMLTIIMGCVPIMTGILLWVWPRTPIGKRLVMTPPPPGEFVWADAGKTDSKSLIGAEGVAETEFLPRGSVRIGDKSYEAVSETGLIEPGMHVKVKRLDVGRLVVYAIRAPKPTDAPMSTGTGLDRPISELDLESLDS